MLFCYYWIIILENCVAIYYFIIWDKTQSSGMVLFIALRSAFYLTQKKEMVCANVQNIGNFTIDPPHFKTHTLFFIFAIFYTTSSTT